MNFKKGDWVICVDTGVAHVRFALSLGKKYEIISIDKPPYVTILDDKLVKRLFQSHRFKLDIKTVRLKKLKQLNNDNNPEI